MEVCTACEHRVAWAELGAGLYSCTGCGHTYFRGLSALLDTWSANEHLTPRTCYTRKKRFKKYMARACLQQSQTTVPDETWEYLLSKRPYRSAQDVIRTLKKARHLKRKCYDSLPFLVENLCNLKVPKLSPEEQQRCLRLFDTVDSAYEAGDPFISYLYVLEYLLHKIGRPEVCNFLSRIQCRKRREKYNGILDKIFGDPVHVPVFILTN